MADATREMAHGRLENPLPVSDDGALTEVDELAISFNQMAEQLANNIDSLRETRRELIYVEKLASLVPVAQGVAHEIGNPLSAVIGYLDILDRSEDASLSDDSRDLLKRSKGELQRIDTIINALLDYSRPGGTEPEAEGKLEQVSIREIIENTVDILSAQPDFSNFTLDTNIRLATGDETPYVMGHKGSLTQILINLCTNAADSLADKDENSKDSHVVISARILEQDDDLRVDENSYIAGSAKFAGTRVAVSVIDHGQGI